MSTAQVCVSWLYHKKSISEGISRLQQSGEFVDMTLAAGGHLVKVHQNIVALASPYLKAMIQSAPCQHPVVFLNNMSNETLGYLLEYIYTGEVKIPTDVIPVFLEACKALCINGVENLVLPKNPTPQPQSEQLEPRIESNFEPPDNNFAAHITINSDNYNVEVIPVENNKTHDRTLPMVTVDDVEINYQPEILCPLAQNENSSKLDNLPIITVDDIEIDFQPQIKTLQADSQTKFEHKNTFPIISVQELDPSRYSTDLKAQNVKKMLTQSDHNTIDQSQRNMILNLSMKEMKPITHETVKTVPPKIGDRDKTHHYAISNRGSLQLMLNRYMYYCHHHACGGRKRRWRCVDYRKLHCPALIDTDDGNITNRSEAHCHPDHDAKILRKFKSKAVFTSITQAAEKCDTFKVKVPKLSRHKKTTLSAPVGNLN